MKQLYSLILILFFLQLNVTAQYVTIPDSKFRNYLKTEYPGCFNSSDMMDTTCTAIITAKTLYISGAYAQNSIDGIQYFDGLEFLNLYSLPISSGSEIKLPPGLDSLMVGSSAEWLPDVKLPAGLSFLNCGGCSLSILPVLPASLKYLDCSNNKMLSLPSSLPASLTYLDCSTNSFAASPNPFPTLPASLKYFYCAQNSLQTLPSLPGTLTELICNHNQLISLPTLPGTLTKLICNDNQLTSISTLPPSLTQLNCSNNKLTSLPTIYGNLTRLSCSNNKLTILPNLPASLTYLECNNNQLTGLPFLYNNLTVLDCSKNNITQIPSIPTSLVWLQAGYNKLNNLPELPDLLKILYCNNNNLTNLPQLPSQLNTLSCENNIISILQSLPAALQSLNCQHNKLTQLPTLPDTLMTLRCYDNDIYCLPILPYSLRFPYVYYPNNGTLGGYGHENEYFAIDTSKIKCLPNDPGVVISAWNETTSQLQYLQSYPLCNPTNNKNHCTSFPVISGRVFYDNNKNGKKDLGELYRPFTKLKLSNGNSCYTNSVGYFEINADKGNFFLYPAELPSYYKSTPDTLHYNITSFDTLIYNQFFLHPNEIVDGLKINISRINAAARPGFNLSYLISFANMGSSTIPSSKVNFSYDGNLLNYNSSSNAAVTNNNYQLGLQVNNFVPGQYDSYIANFKVKTTAPLGAILNTEAMIVGGSAFSVANDQVTIGGSFDPNDKQATPELSPQQVANGKYIDYTIRFQNTGTDTAFSVVIADTLSNLLQTSSLEVLNSSHSCNTTLTGNKIYFEFVNILLPDSNINEQASHGFVTFRIKPLLSVTEGTSITNKASIYFDYNLPIVTNIAATLIQNPILSIQTYTFIGNGNWSNPANWSNNTIPPSNLNNGAQIIIDPAANGECILNIPQVISGTSKLTINAGKKFKINDNLVLQ